MDDPNRVELYWCSSCNERRRRDSLRLEQLVDGDASEFVFLECGHVAESVRPCAVGNPNLVSSI